MGRSCSRLVTLVGVVGTAVSAVQSAEPAEPVAYKRIAIPVPAGHIYYNPSTGERVISAFEEGRRSTSPALWLSNNTDPCGTGGTVGVIDDPDLNGDGRGDLFGGDCDTGTFPCEGTWNNFWGDIAYDSVIDCVVTRYGNCTPDADLDGDSFGDGIVGLDMYLTFSDNDAGFGSDFAGESGRSCIIDLVVPTLSGDISSLPKGFSVVYEVTIDLSNPNPSLVFELGDSDGIDDSGVGNSGGAIYGHPTGNDIDGDGLHDFSFAMRFDQSSLGTDGTPGQTKGYIGFIAAAPKLGNPGDSPPDPADATGLFDATDIYSSGPSCPPLATNYIGTFFFGGFNCEPGTETPHSSMFLELYGPNPIIDGCDVVGACNPADVAEPGGVLDFSDVLVFLQDFDMAGACSDQAPPKGTWDFADVLAFLVHFGEGCP